MVGGDDTGFCTYIVRTASAQEVFIVYWPLSGFSRTHKIGNIGIIANFLFSHISSSFFICTMMLVNVKLDISGYRKITFSKLQTSLVKLIFNGTAKTNLVILTFLCCWEFAKNPSRFNSSAFLGNTRGPKLHPSSVCMRLSKGVFLYRNICALQYV